MKCLNSYSIRTAKALVVFVTGYSLCKELMHLITVFFRCGSIIVDFILEFNQSVVVSDVTTTFQEAVKGGTFGGFQINSIKQNFFSICNTHQRYNVRPFLKKSIFYFIDLLIMQKASGILLRPESVPITR